MWRHAVARLVVLAVVVPGCGVVAVRGTEILGVSAVEGEARSLLVLYGGCESDLPVVVEETAQTVRVRVGLSNGGCDAIQATRIELDEPLGDRAVFDERTEARVPIESGE